MTSRTRGTLCGAAAVLLWSMLALFTTTANGIPAFELLALTFAIAFALSMIVLALRGRQALAKLRQRPAVWLLGVGGLFGYHLFYFIAFDHAPPVDAGLIAYLWPLLIVLFSALLPGEHLRWYHVVGGVMGLLGAGLLITGGKGFEFQSQYSLGYFAAALCALIWSSYSVANRRFGDVPTEVVGGFCGAVALLGALAHLSFETTVVPSGGQWLAIFALGLGPVGAAFFFWDYGTKHGDIQLLGALSYLAPLLSTILLVATGRAQASWFIAAACVLIVMGAVFASLPLLTRRK